MNKEFFRYYYYLTRAVLAPLNNRQNTTEEIYYFIHIPKTCGTSFRFMLYKQFPQSVIFPNLAHLRKNGGKYYKFPEVISMKETIQDSTHLFMGHYSFRGINRIFDKKINYLTFLRHPVKRTISNIQHLQRIRPEYKNASLSEIFEDVQASQKDLQTRFLSNKPNKRPTEMDRLPEAKRNLEKIKFVGIAEKFQESIQLIEHTFNWNLGNTLKLNQRKGNTDNELSEDLLNKIKAINELDIELYEHACLLFEKRYSEIK